VRAKLSLVNAVGLLSLTFLAALAFVETAHGQRLQGGQLCSAYLASLLPGAEPMTAEEAIAVCTRAIEAGGSKRKLADYHYNRGLAYWTSGEVEKAIADYDASIALNPTPDAYEKRGNAWFWKKDYDRAIADFEQSVKREANGRVYASLCAAQRLKGDLDAALKGCDQAVRRASGYAPSFRNRGDVWRLKGDLDKAISDYDAALELDGGFTGALTGRGLAYQAKGEPDQARADFEAAIEGQPRYVDGEEQQALAQEALATL
jgi:tetratricopeptide (TPR) repeat protein